jgi:hypothetical protein
LAAAGDTAIAGQAQGSTGEERVSPPPSESQTGKPDGTDRHGQVLTEARRRARRISLEIPLGR